MVSAFAATDLVIFVTSWSPTHSPSVIEAMRSGLRVLSMPGVRGDMLDTGAMTADYAGVHELTVGWGQRFARGRRVHITTPLGTDVTADLGGFVRLPLIDGGTLPRGRGGLGNMPAGEVAICPMEGSTEGLVVADLTVSTTKRPLGRPIEFEIRSGRVTRVSGGQEAADFDAALRAHGETASVVAEIALGTNHAARHIGIVIEDEKMLATAHLGFGNAIGFGGLNRSTIHIDAIFGGVTFDLDGELLVADGQVVPTSLEPPLLDAFHGRSGHFALGQAATELRGDLLFARWLDAHGSSYWTQVGDKVASPAAAKIIRSRTWSQPGTDPRLIALLEWYGVIMAA